MSHQEVQEELNILIDEGFLGLGRMMLHGDLYAEEPYVYTKFGEWFTYLISEAIEKGFLNNLIIDLDLTVIDKKD